MTWPDPDCPMNHEPGSVYKRWEHTPNCNRRAPTKYHKDRRIAEVVKDIEPLREPNSDDLLKRARNAGAV